MHFRANALLCRGIPIPSFSSSASLARSLCARDRTKPVSNATLSVSAPARAKRRVS